MNNFLRIFIGLSIVLLAMSVTALSCNKGGDKSNSGGGNNSGGETPASSVCADNPATSCLELTVPTAARGYAKLVDKTNIVINATGLANSVFPHSGATDADRSFSDADFMGRVRQLFSVDYPGAAEALTFVNRKNVNGKDITTNSMTLDAAISVCRSGSESEDNNYAKNGRHCVGFAIGDDSMLFTSYLGTVFDNANTNTHARGLLRCLGRFQRRDNMGNLVVIDNNTVARGSATQACRIAVVNNAANATDALAAAEIDDNWVDPSAGSTTEIELYAVGIDIVGKTIPKLLPDADKFDRDKLIAGVNNETFKKILKNNKWRDLKFKIKIVKSADY